MQSNHTQFYNVPSQNTSVTNENIFVKSTLVLTNNVKINKFETNFLNLNGKIQGYDIQDIIQDTAFVDNFNYISGTKHFENKINFDKINIKNLNNIDLSKLKQGYMKWMDTVTIREPVSLDEVSNVKNCYFEELNGVLDKESFGKAWLMTSGDQTIKEQNFDFVQFNNVEIKSELLNRINISDVYKNMYRTDREEKFDTVKFGKNFKIINDSFHFSPFFTKLFYSSNRANFYMISFQGSSKIKVYS